MNSSATLVAGAFLILIVGLGAAFWLRRRLSIETNPRHASWGALINLIVFTVQMALFTFNHTGFWMVIGFGTLLLVLGMLVFAVFTNWQDWGERLWASGFAGKSRGIPYASPTGSQQIAGTVLVIFALIGNALLIAINFANR